MTRSKFKKSLLLGVVMTTAAVVGTFAHSSQSASLTSTSVTLSNPRISFRGQVDAGNTAGTSQLIIETVGNPSNTTAGLVEDDVLQIGSISGDTFTSYGVKDLISASQLSLDSVLVDPDDDANSDIIVPQTGTAFVRFTTASAVNNGSFRILIPAAATLSNDGNPDQLGWDFNGNTASNVTCPADTGNFDFGTPTVDDDAVTINTQHYHAVSCPYTGTGDVGTSFSGDPIEITGLVNPAPAAGHTTGNADTYPIIVQNMASDATTVVDSTTVRVGTIEAVRITASVAPQLTFTITGIAASTSVCGLTTDVTTTATAVPLGELQISTFTEAAQNLLVSTNASNGYAVTALANDQLGKDGETCVGDPTANTDCIPDSPGDGTTMGPGAAAEDDWTNTATKGFAYTLDNNDAGSVPFQYSSVSGGCTNTGGADDCYRQFADAENTQPAVTIMSNTTVADSQDTDICYKAIISASQAAGNYETYVTYTATATF